MDVGKAIFNILINDSNIVGLISDDSSGTNSRIFPSRYNFPNTVKLPYIIYQVVSDEPNNTKNGVSTYDYVTVQISIYDKNYAKLNILSAFVRTALDYVSGTFNGVQVDKIFFQNENDLFDDSAAQQGLFGIAQDYRFNINR